MEYLYPMLPSSNCYNSSEEFVPLMGVVRPDLISGIITSIEANCRKSRFSTILQAGKKAANTDQCLCSHRHD